MPESGTPRNRKIIIRLKTGEVLAETAWINRDDYDRIMWALGEFSSPYSNWEIEIKEGF